MLTAFRVRSDRMHSMSVAEGTTVGTLKEVLRRNGFDIDETTHVEVHRQNTDTMIGKLDDYQLRNGDCVQFITQSLQVGPALRHEQERHVSVCETIRNGVKAACRVACGCGRSLVRSANVSETQGEIKAAGSVGKVTVTPTENGFVVKFSF